MPRPPLRVVAPRIGIVVLVISVLTGCTNQPSDAPVDPRDLTATVPNETLVPPERTLPARDEIPKATAEAILGDVTAALGVDLPAGASECVVGGLIEGFSGDELAEFGPNGIVSDAGDAFQIRVLQVFDECVDSSTLALAGGPLLVAAGATDTKATCFFRLVRDEMGMGGFYRYSAAREGAFDVDERLTLLMASITKRCAIDPAALAVPTTTNPVAEPTVVGGSTVQSVPTTLFVVPATTRLVVSVETNAPRVTLVAATSTTEK